MNWIRDVLSDLEFAARSLFRAPLFTAAAVLTIALGTGVNAAVFNVIYAVLLNPLPYRTPERLVHLGETHPAFPWLQVAAPDFYDWQRMSTSFDQLAAHTFQAMNKWTIVGDGEPEPVQTVQASHNLFPMLGVEPLVGRLYTAEEEASKTLVVLFSETLWRRKYRSDPSIVGRKIRLVNTPATVVGVIAQRQALPRWADVWMPLSLLDPALTQTRRFHTLEVVGQVKAGTPLAQAQGEMRRIARDLARAYPDTNATVGASVLPLKSWITGEVRPALLIAWAAVLLVLLLACANVAHLVLVRAVHRSREMAIRTALGAGSARLARFLLAENLLVALGGGTLGVLLTALLLPWMSQQAAGEIPRLDSTYISPAAFLYICGATVVCAVLFAIPAIVHSRRLDLQQVMKQGRGASLTHRRSWFGASIIATEIALAFVVLTGGGLLYRSFVAMLHEPTGFTAQGVIAADVFLAPDWKEAARMFEQQLSPRLRAIPGVSFVAAVNCAPMTLQTTEISRFATRFGVAGRTYPPDQLPVAQLRWTTPEYFRALRIPVRRGRLFSDADTGKPGYLINEALARLYFPNQDPVGQQLVKDIAGPAPQNVPILGVLGDVRDLALEIEPRPMLYELAVSSRMTILLRAEVTPSVLIPAVRSAIRAVNPDAPVTTLAPLERIIETSLAKRRFALDLLAIFAVLAAVLTAIGVYSVTGYSLSQRTSDFGIRFALGAQRSQICRQILLSFAAPTLAGVAAGGLLANAFAHALRGQLYKLSPADPLVLLLSAAGLILLVLLSALRPVMRAASVSPTAFPRE